jgi:hypothetical protein
MERTDREVETLADRLFDLLAEIAELFQDDVVLTLVARSMNSPDGSRDTCITDDPDREAAVEALARLWRDPNVGTIAEEVRKVLQ